MWHSRDTGNRSTKLSRSLFRTVFFLVFLFSMLLLLLLLLLEQRRLRKPERGSRICRFLGFLSSCRCSVGCGGRENKKSTGNTHNKTKHRERERERERETTFHFCYRIVRVSDRDTRGPAFPNGIVARCSIFFHHQTGCLGFRFCVGSLLFCRVRFQTRARLRCRVAFPSTLCCVVVWIYYDLQKRKSGGETIVIFSGHVRIKPESCCDSMSKRQHRVVLFAFRVAAELMDVVNDARHTQNRNNNDAQKKNPNKFEANEKGTKEETKQNKTNVGMSFCIDGRIYVPTQTGSVSAKRKKMPTIRQRNVRPIALVSLANRKKPSYVNTFHTFFRAEPLQPPVATLREVRFQRNGEKTR